MRRSRCAGPEMALEPHSPPDPTRITCGCTNRLALDMARLACHAAPDRIAAPPGAPAPGAQPAGQPPCRPLTATRERGNAMNRIKALLVVLAAAAAFAMVACGDKSDDTSEEASVTHFAL